MPDSVPNPRDVIAEARGPWTMYVCNGCGFTALEPVMHMHQIPRLPVPGFHKHTAAMMLPVEVVPVQQQPERGAEEALAALDDAGIGHDVAALRGAVERLAEEVAALRPKDRSLAPPHKRTFNPRPKRKAK